MPRPSCSAVQELRFTAGDYERKHIIKPLGDVIEDAARISETAKWVSYATAAGIVVAPVALFGGLYYVGKGLAGMDFSLLDVNSDTPIIGGQWWLKKALESTPGVGTARWITKNLFGIDVFDSVL